MQLELAPDDPQEVCPHLVPTEVIPLIQALVVPGVLFLLTLAFVAEWIDRKTVARLQNRVGPRYAGAAGILQPLADFIKLIAKEDITPSQSDRPVFHLAPIALLTLTLTPLFLIPMVNLSALVAFEGDLIILMFITTLIALTMFIASWASTNRFSTIGGVRLALLMLGYEIPLTVAAIGPAIVAESLSISRIVEYQSNTLWFAVSQPLGFAVLIVCVLAELQLVPFDIPHAETELVAGWFVEFSGKKLALLRLAKNFELVLAASLMTALYLGGPSGPGVLPWNLQRPVYFLVKSLTCLLVLANLRALFARFRIDQVLQGAWKYLTPLALLQVALVELSAVILP
jgi:NADH-quinone oxidoreductase subunit H